MIKRAVQLGLTKAAHFTLPCEAPQVTGLFLLRVIQCVQQVNEWLSTTFDRHQIPLCKEHILKIFLLYADNGSSYSLVPLLGDFAL